MRWLIGLAMRIMGNAIILLGTPAIFIFGVGMMFKDGFIPGMAVVLIGCSLSFSFGLLLALSGALYMED